MKKYLLFLIIFLYIVFNFVFASENLYASAVNDGISIGNELSSELDKTIVDFDIDNNLQSKTFFSNNSYNTNIVAENKKFIKDIQSSERYGTELGIIANQILPTGVINDSNNLKNENKNENKNNEYYVTCRKFNNVSKTCNLKHSYFLNNIQINNGSLNAQKCDPSDSRSKYCISMWAGENKKSLVNSLPSYISECDSKTLDFDFELSDFELLDDLVLTEISYKDEISLSISIDSEKIINVLNKPVDLRKSECIESEFRTEKLNLSLKDIINQNHNPSNKNVRIKIKAEGFFSKDGAVFFKLNLYYDPRKMVKAEKYDNLKCLYDLYDLYDSFNENLNNKNFESRCIQKAITSNNCQQNGLLDICKNDFEKPSIFTELKKLNSLWDPFCKNMYVTIDTFDEEIIIPKCGEVLNEYSYCVETEDIKNTIVEDKYKDDKNISTYKCFDKYYSAIEKYDVGECKYSEVISQDTVIHTKDNVEVCQLICDSDCISTCSDSVLNYCEFLKKECLDDNDRNFGCINNVLSYKCKETFTTNITNSKRIIDCTDSNNLNIRCLGTECVSDIIEEESNFEDVLENLQMAQYLQDDLNCSNANGEKKSSCVIFKGEQKSCSEGFGGSKRCCNSPKNFNKADYIKLLMYTMSLKKTLFSLDSEELDFGGWQDKIAIKAGGLISSPFDTIVTSLTPKNSSEIAKSYSNALTLKLADYVEKTFGEELKQILFTETVASNGQKGVVLNPQITSIAQKVTQAYIAYQLSMTLKEIITSCSSEDIETSMRIAMDSCVYSESKCKKKILGKCLEEERIYCCYNSPLAKLVNEQLVNKDLITLGECVGINASDLQNIDFSEIDLSKWTKIMQDNNLIKTKDLNLDILTGNGSALSVGNRPNSAKRTEEHLK
ncbi:MAG: conjugal transfer protein TraN [Succinivibrionaceae bacterium]